MKLAIAVVALLPLMAADGGRPQEERKTLEEPRTIQGFSCAGGYAWFYSDGGALRSCAVSREASFGEALVPEGSRVHLTREGKPDFVFLSRDAAVRNLTCRGGGHSYMTAFHGSGKLRLCWLAADQNVDGVPCMRASFFADVFGGGAGTYFHESGRLKSCKLAGDFTDGQRVYKRGDRLTRDDK